MQDSVVLVNLRVLAKLQPGDRLQCCESKYFGIDRGYFSWLWRWVKSDTRHIALERLEDTITSANELSKVKNLDSLISGAADGLSHLLDTYHTDPTTVARLESLIARCTATTTPTGSTEMAL